MSETRTEVSKWVEEIADARRREKHWRDAAKKAEDIFSGKVHSTFNILFSNTETLAPALYNNPPRPAVDRRFKDADPVGRMAAQVGKRVLEYCIDTNSEEYQSYHDAMLDAVGDSLVPGRAMTRVKYDADISGTESMPVVKYELVCYDSIPWEKVVFAKAKKWSKLPWLSIDHDITREEAKELFGKEKADKLTYSVREDTEDNESKDRHVSENEERKTTRIYEVWDKDTRKVRFISPNDKEDYLKVEDDPLGLSGFFPMPRPLQLIRRPNNMEPLTLYSQYENQARELDRISVRINKIVEAMKVRGIYDSTLTELKQVLTAKDNEMIAATDVANLNETKLEQAIWLYPVEKLVSVLQQLILAREQAKKVIFEITGIADVQRGSTVASETATAQQIKDKWGVLRLKRGQAEVQRYARDMLRITLEIAAAKFSPETFKAMTGIPLPTQEDKKAAEMRQMLATQQGMDLSQEDQQTLSNPSWEEVIGALKNDSMRQYKIDVETNSTVDVDATEDKQDMGEALNAIAQFMNGVAPLVETGAMPFQVAQTMLLTVVRRFRFGTEVEDYIKQMQPPKPQDDGKDAEIEKGKLELEAKNKELDFEKQKMAAEKEMTKREVALQIKELKLEARELAFKLQQEQAQAQMQAQGKEQELANQKHKMDITETVTKATRSTEDRVRSMVDKGQKEQGAARQADVAQTKAIGQAVMDMVKNQGEVLDAVRKLAESIMAPKKRTLTKNSDGTKSIIEEAM